MKKFIYIFIIFLSTLYSQQSYTAEVTEWLKTEIDKILISYQDPALPNENKFLMIEQTINNNFAGTGIAKFVSGESWKNASKETKKEYIKIFKRHLALSIASIMQGYSNQQYKLSNSQYDEKNKVSLIDMEIFSDTGSVIVTWRVKQSKDRFFIIDLIVADISLVVAKRSEFNSVLKSVNFNLDEFNKKLSEQNNISYQKIIK
tara:strand:- start:711 stop:1319 length:609 start_codon:yes stop_codon:yes gene_type:complete